MSTTDLEQLSVDHPLLDVQAEWDRACRKYGFVSVSWFRLHWLPRARPKRQLYRKTAKRRAQERDRAWAIASALAMPDGWPTWFAGEMPSVTVPAWSEAPIDLRLRYAAAKMAQEAKAEGDIGPRKASINRFKKETGSGTGRPVTMTT